MQNKLKSVATWLSILIVASLMLNLYLMAKQKPRPFMGKIIFSNANSRDTYFTVHNVKAAHAISTGKGIKVGIMDWLFGYATHPNLYAGAVNFTQHQYALDSEEHGLWLANTLREIAPGCDIYALCTTDPDDDEDKQVDNMVRAIDWAIENNIDVLAYSNRAFSEKNRPKIDEAVDKAVKHGIVTTFIHYDNPNNLYPDGFFGGSKADVNILHYDFNVLFLNKYESFMNLKGDYSKIQSGDDVPYLSMSSTSPVLAGFVAILKAINPDLSPTGYKDILVKTSYQTEYYDWGFGRKSNVPRAVDIGNAAAYIKER